eukprot:4419530-Pyramimonas_sp.AAC.1
MPRLRRASQAIAGTQARSAPERSRWERPRVHGRDASDRETNGAFLRDGCEPSPSSVPRAPGRTQSAA